MAMWPPPVLYDIYTILHQKNICQYSNQYWRETTALDATSVLHKQSSGSDPTPCHSSPSNRPRKPIQPDDAWKEVAPSCRFPIIAQRYSPLQAQQMLDLIAIFVGFGDHRREDEVFKDLAETQASIDQEDTGDMSIGGEMIGQMAWHRAPIIRDQHEVEPFAPQQYRRIERTERWGTGITDSPDDQIRRTTPKRRE